MRGSEHYRGTAQPIDIYKSKGVFKPFALCSIIKYATRNLDKDLNPKDITKIIHYAELLLAENKERDEESLRNITTGGCDNGMGSSGFVQFSRSE